MGEDDFDPDFNPYEYAPTRKGWIIVFLVISFLLTVAVFLGVLVTLFFDSRLIL